MKTKQIIGILVAGLVFILIGVSSMAADKYLGSKTEGIFDKLSSSLEDVDTDKPDGKYVGLIRVEGTIQDSGSSSDIFEKEGYDHRGTLDTIDDYIDDDDNVGILLYVNSPGGTVNAADELYLKLKEYKKTKRPIYVYMGDEACSGGYYISAIGDKIYANRNTWTGSIGVYIQLSNYKVLFDKLGIKTTYIKAGKNKTMGSATQDLTDEQKDILQSLVDESYDQFVDVIVAGRKNMTEEEVRKAADGRIYSSAQAKEVGLIDDIKTYEEVEDLIYDKLGEDVEIYEDEGEQPSLLDIFTSGMNALLKLKSDEKTETEKVLDYVQNDGSGVPMYYAMPEQ